VGCAQQNVVLPREIEAVIIHRPIMAPGKTLATPEHEWLLSLLQDCTWTPPLHTPPAPELFIQLLPRHAEPMLFQVYGSHIYASVESGVAVCQVASSASLRLARLDS
jgi:hypothetical protein